MSTVIESSRRPLTEHVPKVHHSGPNSLGQVLIALIAFCVLCGCSLLVLYQSLGVL